MCFRFAVVVFGQICYKKFIGSEVNGGKEMKKAGVKLLISSASNNFLVPVP